MSTHIRVETYDGSMVEVTAVTEQPLSSVEHQALLDKVTELSGHLRNLERPTIRLRSKGGTE